MALFIVVTYCFHRFLLLCCLLYLLACAYVYRPPQLYASMMMMLMMISFSDDDENAVTWIKRFLLCVCMLVNRMTHTCVKMTASSIENTKIPMLWPLCHSVAYIKNGFTHKIKIEMNAIHFNEFYSIYDETWRFSGKICRSFNWIRCHSE